MGAHVARTHARRPRLVLCAVFEGTEPWGVVADLYAPCDEDEDEGEWGWRRMEGATIMALQPLIEAWKTRYGLRFGDISTAVSEGMPPLGEAAKVMVSTGNRASHR